MNPYRLVTIHFGQTLSILNVIFLFLWATPGLAAKHGSVLPKEPESPLVVILDPGHGGNDTGAIGLWKNSKNSRTRRLVEKEVVLDLARRVQMELENDGFARALGRPIRVYLTRDKDGFVSLDSRADLARKRKADLFVSLHANAEITGTVQGFEIYYLDNASKESYSHHETLHERRKKRGKPKHKDPRLALLLRSISTDSTLSQSKLAARTLQESIMTELKSDGYPIKDRGIRKALLQVLLDAETPGVLIEALYLSHPDDRKLIQHPQARNSIATGIAKGILRYLAKIE